MVVFFIILVFLTIIAAVLIIIAGLGSNSQQLRSFFPQLGLNTAQYKGIVGETRVKNILSRLPNDYKILNDVVLTTERGTTQIDHIVISKYGVFTIETKNYCGDIYGNDNSQEWTQVIVTNVRYRKNWYKTYSYVTKNHLYNPVKQSVGHAIEIEKSLNYWPYLSVIPIVVFTGSASLNNIVTTHHVVYSNNLLDTILNYRIAVLSETDVYNITQTLINKNVRAYISNTTHVNNLKIAKIESDKKIASDICPRCGGYLVKRTGNYGSFYGCSNYPKCKFTINK